MKFRQQIAKYVTGNLTTSQLPEIAITGIEEGFNSESLLILAGLNITEDASEIENYFNKTLSELNICRPDHRNAALQYAVAIVDEIFEGKKSVIKGVDEIKNNAIGSYDFYSETIKYCYDSIGFDSIYGLYVSYYDIIDAEMQFNPMKTNEMLKQEIIIELREELIKWREKLKSAYNKS